MGSAFWEGYLIGVVVGSPVAAGILFGPAAAAIVLAVIGIGLAVWCLLQRQGATLDGSYPRAISRAACPHPRYQAMLIGEHNGVRTWTIRCMVCGSRMPSLPDPIAVEQPESGWRS